MPEAPVLSVRHLTKRFPGQLALSDVELDLHAGEVHALIGENGSGKSTLIKCLAGFYEPEPGSQVVLDGAVIEHGDTARLRDGGIAFVHQDLGLIPTMSVLENLLVSHGYAQGRVRQIRWRSERRRVRELLREYGLAIDPDTMVRHLSVADQTLVAIVRALTTARRSARVLVLDEPTAALPHGEVRRLFAWLEQLKQRGVAMLYVSHRLDELFEISERITVLRDGRRVGTFETGRMTEPELIRHIVGGEPSALYPDHEADVGREPLLQVSGLSGNRLADVSLSVRPGEIVGVAGLLGSGRSELARLLAGVQRRATGTVALDGRKLELKTPAEAIAAGICLVPEDRRADGSVQSMTLAENLTLTGLRKLTRGGVLRRRAERARAAALAQEYFVRPPDLDRRFGAFSGGNQQKAVLAKWLSLDPQLIVLDEPVKGIDIGARAEVYSLIERQAERGAAVLMISSEVDDLTQLCDRVLVLRAGVLVGELAGASKTKDNILNLALSGSRQ